MASLTLPRLAVLVSFELDKEYGWNPGRSLALVPTLFTGHMSGVNSIPAWALGGTDRDNRFRVVSNGRVNGSGLRNWYSDPLIARAQALLATETDGALAATRPQL